MSKTRQKIKIIVNQYTNILENLGIKTQRVILYGSYAEGTAHRNSDIDLIVVSEDFKGMSLRERLEILGIAAVRIMKPIEAKGYTAQEIKKISSLSFLSEALHKGVFI